MTSERENNFNETENGLLTVRSFNIAGNDIDAFYDSAKDLIFVLDKTINSDKPNVLLVMNPDGDKKWDEILSGQYNVDLETVRPKVDNKYQKLDIEYSGLMVYDNLINAYVSGADLDEHLIQLGILRDSATRHSAMTRLDTANEIISRTNVTIVKTKETIVRLQERLKTLRDKLADQKHEIGRVSTKQSAAKILKTESQIDSTNERLKQAKKRLESAQKRLEVATVDAKLASDLLNREPFEIKDKTMAVAIKPDVKTVKPVEKITEEYSVQEPELEENGDKDMEEKEEKIVSEEDSDTESRENDIKPLLDKDPEIINEDIAFKPISFEPSGFDVNDLPEPEPEPELPAPDSSETDLSGDEVADAQQDDENKDVDTGDDAVHNGDYETHEEPAISFEPVVPEINTDLPEEKPVLDSMIPVPEISYDENSEADNSYEEKSDDVVAVENNVEHSDFNSVYDNNIGDSGRDYALDAVVDSDIPENKKDNYVDAPAVPNTDNLIRPMPAFVPAPIDNGNNTPEQPVIPVEEADRNRSSKSSLLYYFLLVVLIIVSVITLWLYQKHMGDGNFNWFSKNPSEEVIEPIDDADIPEPIGDPEPPVQPVSVPVKPEQPVEQEVTEQPAEPIIFGGVPANVSAFGSFAQQEEEQKVVDTVVDKPTYATDSKYDDMFVYEEEDNGDGEYVVEQDAPMVVVDEVYDDYVEYPEEYVEGYAEEFVDGNSVAYVDDDILIIVDDEPDTEPENTAPDTNTTQENRVVYNGDDIYAPDVPNGDYMYDIEEDEYQSGDDGYGQY